MTNEIHADKTARIVFERLEGYASASLGEAYDAARKKRLAAENAFHAAKKALEEANAAFALALSDADAAYEAEIKDARVAARSAAERALKLQPLTA